MRTAFRGALRKTACEVLTTSRDSSTVRPGVRSSERERKPGRSARNDNLEVGHKSRLALARALGRR
jgi:hypothetical protein